MISELSTTTDGDSITYRSIGHATHGSAAAGRSEGTDRGGQCNQNRRKANEHIWKRKDCLEFLKMLFRKLADSPMQPFYAVLFSYYLFWGGTYRYLGWSDPTDGLALRVRLIDHI
jgi:hypothetical protein